MMTSFTRFAALTLSLALVSVLCSSVPQYAAAAASERALKVPHSAFEKTAREDLLRPLHAQAEVRVIVGLQTPEPGEGIGPAADDVRQSRIAARQTELLGRLPARAGE